MKNLLIALSIILIVNSALASDKFQLELLAPLKPFEMQVGEPIEIKFKALSNRSDLKYVIFIRHADNPPWENDEGPLTLKTLPLKMGENTFQWDGKSFGWAPTDAPEMGQLKSGKKGGRYYFVIYVLQSEKPIVLLGMLGNYHKHVITKLRSKNFTIK